MSMYPRNAASPPRIALGAVVQISDGAVQSSGVSVAVRPEGGSETGGGGTVSYGGSSGVVYYAPTQAETNYTAFTVVAYKTGCVPVAVTVVTTATSVAGTVDVGAISGDAAAADNLEAAADGTGYNLGGGSVVAASVTGNVGGDVTGSVGSVAAGGITASSLANDCITATKIATGAIDADAIADGAIDNGALADGAITAAKLATGAITAAKFAAGAIDAAAIATDAIDADALKADAVSEIQSGLATTTHLNAVEADTQDIQSRLPAALVSGRIAADAVAISGSTVAADAVEANIGNLDASVNSRSSHSAADVWAVATRVLTANTNLNDPSAATIAAAVWDLSTTGHTTGGTFGAAMVAAGSAGDPWATTLPGAYTAGSAGYILGTNLNATVGSRQATFTADTGLSFPTNFAALDISGAGAVTAGTVGDKTGYALATAPPTAAENADALLGRNVAGGSSTGRTVSQALYALRNKVSVSGATMTVYGTDDTTTSWTAALTSDAAAEPITAVDPG